MTILHSDGNGLKTSSDDQDVLQDVELAVLSEGILKLRIFDAVHHELVLRPVNQ